MKKIKRTERGWAGHCIISDDCRYHRNTLLEYKDLKVVVSTIGRYIPKNRVMNGDYRFRYGWSRQVLRDNGIRCR